MIEIDDCQGAGYRCTGFQEGHEFPSEAVVLITESGSDDNSYYCLECLIALVRDMDDEIETLYSST